MSKRNACIKTSGALLPKASRARQHMANGGVALHRVWTVVLQYHSSSVSHHCTAVSGLACSVASLSQFPDHYPPGYHSLRHRTLADRWFD